MSVTGLVSGLGSMAASVINNYAEDKRAQKQREWNEEMMDKQNAWSLDMWNKTNEYNSPSEQLRRLQDAGLNPLYYGLDGTSANGLESAQPLGYDRASTQGIANPVEAFTQGRAADKQIELMNKQIDKLDSDIDNQDAQTAGLKLDNEFKDRTMNARVEGEELAVEIMKTNKKKAETEINHIKEQIKETIARTENEHEKQLLIQAQTALNKAQEKEILELIPYEKNLKAAQTEAQKAAASASYWNAMYQKGLVTSGYIDAMCDKMKADAKNAEGIAAINDFKARVKNGGTFTINDNDWWITKQGKHILNSFFEDISIIGEALTGPLVGVFK